MIQYIALSFLKARPLIEKQTKGARYQKIDSFSFNKEAIEKLLSSQSLFDAQVIVLYDILHKDHLVFLKPLLLSTSHTVFIVESDDFVWKKDFIKSVKGEVVKVAEQKVAGKAKKFSYAFDVGNALLGKDKKTAWIAYQKALQNDEDPNAIHSAVWWTIKQLIVPSSRFAKYQKSYTPQAISHLATWWMGVIHESRKKNTDLSLAIEKAILEM